MTGGRLGIATSNPLSALHVAGGVDASPAAAGFHAGMSGNYAAIEMAGSDGGFIDFQDATDGNDHAGRIIYAHSDDTMKFSTAGVQRLTITSNGNATFNGTVFAPNVSLYPNSSAPNADAAIFRPQDGHLGFVAAASERGRFAGGTFLVGKTSSGTTTAGFEAQSSGCLLYTSPSPRDGLLSRMPSSA